MVSDKDYDGETTLQNSRPCPSTLCDKCLDIDGIREILITALEGCYAKSGYMQKHYDEC